MSDSSKSVAEAVRLIIESDGAVRNGLSRGLINVRALARYIQKTACEEGTLDAVIGAIRRYPVKDITIKSQNIGKLLTKLTMKNRIVDVAMLNDAAIPPALGKFSSEVDYSRGETFRIVAGVEIVRVVIDAKNLSKLTSVIPQKNIVKIVEHLTEIIVSLDDAAGRTPGVISAVTSELAINGINLIEFMSCVPELIIVVDQKDALRTYAPLERMSSFGVS